MRPAGPTGEQMRSIGLASGAAAQTRWAPIGWWASATRAHQFFLRTRSENQVVNLAYVIAGSEATGGAGIQVDLKTFQQLGVYGLGTVTCIVSFDPENDWAHRFVPIEPQVIADQIEAATSAHDVNVVKIGMLGTPATIDVVSGALAQHSFGQDRKSTRLNSSHVAISYAVFCLKKKNQ